MHVYCSDLDACILDASFYAILNLYRLSDISLVRMVRVVGLKQTIFAQYGANGIVEFILLILM